MTAQDQTPVSPETFGKCVVCSVGAYRNKALETHSSAECYGRLVRVGDVPGLPE